MADRVSANITIGGAVSPTQFEMLTHLIVSHDLSTEWNGPKYTPDQLVKGEPLCLYALETPWGMFDDFEQYCCEQHIPYVRWSGACPGSFGAERIVFDGIGGPLNYSVDDDDHIVLHEQTIDQLGSMRAIRAYLKPAAFEPPVLIVTA
jgi:hypothetical protein